MKKRQIGFYLTEEFYERLSAKAESQGRSFSEIIRHLLWLWVEGKIDG